jgi:hypothetical protein
VVWIVAYGITLIRLNPRPGRRTGLRFADRFAV